MSDLLPTVRPTHGASDWLTDCKMCRHGIFKGQPYVHLSNPMGLSHAQCARDAAPTHTYRAIFEIADTSRPMSALVAEACGSLDVMAARAGARICGEPRWSVAGDRLVCEAPAMSTEPVDWSADHERRDVEVRRLSGLGWSLRQIGDVLGISHTAVRDILTREAT